MQFKQITAIFNFPDILGEDGCEDNTEQTETEHADRELCDHSLEVRECQD